MLLSKKKAAARYAAPLLQQGSDKTQTESFGHSEQQHILKKENETLTPEPLWDMEVRAIRRTTTAENVNRIMMVKREDYHHILQGGNWVEGGS